MSCESQGKGHHLKEPLNVQCACNRRRSPQRVCVLQFRLVQLRCWHVVCLSARRAARKRAEKAANGRGSLGGLFFCGKGWASAWLGSRNWRRLNVVSAELGLLLASWIKSIWTRIRPCLCFLICKHRGNRRACFSWHHGLNQYGPGSFGFEFRRDTPYFNRSSGRGLGKSVCETGSSP